MALTDAAIRATKPAKKPFKIYDPEGLILLVNPGGSKLWRWRYWADGKEKQMAPGEYPIVNLAEARERHFAARKKVAAGTANRMPRCLSRTPNGRWWLLLLDGRGSICGHSTDEGVQRIPDRHPSSVPITNCARQGKRERMGTTSATSRRTGVASPKRPGRSATRK